MPSCRKKPNSKEKLGEKPRKGARKGSKKGSKKGPKKGSSKEEVEVVEVFPAGTKIQAEGGMYTALKRLDADIGDYQMENYDFCLEEARSLTFVDRGRDTNEERYYLHVEPLKVEGIMMEAYILNKAVQEAKNEKLFGGRPKHFQTIIDSGQTKTYRFAVLTLSGPSLLQLQAKAGGTFKPNAAAWLTMQSLEALRDFHRLGFVHKNIKPYNFFIEKDNAEKLFIGGFDYARKLFNEDGDLIAWVLCLP